ncbi:TonB family protein [Rubrivivax benzoatilyticus]|uniref:TonB family protein n=2 Tax=Sphaerotilaceae TaxID=2975441 RepID=A0ABX0HZ71_9BURK|nr:TonB family protein [Rubrivivax benzoatilyticus]EGJ11612.1 hypothetical protein RBXJA2T_14846 [Rubrivivax benzoatilyticus JA2 = ATCC BAA-35]NHK99162.1 TonB family protein [Rubrivivax benzoatilyticus]NHL24975.1 TonB family protein [Rubrivivax benzoatilyticus]
MVEVIKAPIETKIIEEVKPPEPPPPENLPPPPKFAPPPPSFVPPPEVNVNPPPTPAPTITTTTVAPPPQAVTVPRAEAPPAPRNVRPTIISARSCAPTREDYPAAAVRAEATGTTKVRFTVDASGRVSASELVRSAGPSREHKLLDRVAINKLSQCQFRPGTDEHGNAIGGQAEVEYVWNLE